MVFEVHVRKWHAVAQWTWNAGDENDVCGICRMEYESSPHDTKFPGDDAPVVRSSLPFSDSFFLPAQKNEVLQVWP